LAKNVCVNPVTRVEGHGKISLIFDDDGKISDARFCVQEFRGFEKFCEGSPAERLPLITSRVCGICPMSHHLASTKAVENCFETEITPTARKIRELMALGQLIESHMLSIAVLSLPDLIYDRGDPSTRNIVGMYEDNKEIVGKLLEVRSVGTEVAKIAARRPGHPIGSRIGGVVKAISKEEAKGLLDMVQGSHENLLWFSKSLHNLCEKRSELINMLGDIKTAYMGIYKDGEIGFYDGNIRIIDEDGKLIEDFKPESYFDLVEEKIENWSYMKFPALKSGKSFRVGPLARVNIAGNISYPITAKEMMWFKGKFGEPAHKTLPYHFARYIEVLYAFERIEKLLRDKDIFKDDIFVRPEVKAGKGVGVVEAPRGTLVHSYELDNDGSAVSVDLFVATQHNNYGFNDSLKETASKLITSENPDEVTLNQLEMIVRAYDPCLSCATHSLGGRSFKIELWDSHEHLIRKWDI
jgi:coenzyme F420-reducing hydrogenase alpha subunit